MADENSTTVIQDGQLAVATVAQTGDILTGTSTIDTTAVVQTADGPQLCVKTVDLNGGGGGGGYVLPPATAETLGGIKVGENLTVESDGTLNAQAGSQYELPPATAQTLGGIKVGQNLTVESDGTLNAQAGGGSDSTLTFLENKMGTTFDVSTLGTIKSVYRNGVLQRPYTDITKKIYNATGSQQYVKIDKFIDFNSADNWCISFLVKNSGNWGDCRIMSNALADHTTPVFTMDNNRLLHLYLSSDGTSWSFIANRSLNLTMENHTDYYLRLGFTGSKYYFDAAKAGGTWQRYDSFDSTTKIYSGESNSRISFLTTGWESGGVYISSISFSPQDLQIFTNNQIVFDGLTAVEGTDWSNVNANETVTTAPSNEGYKVAGTTLTLSDELLPPETLAIESVAA